MKQLFREDNDGKLIPIDMEKFLAKFKNESNVFKDVWDRQRDDLGIVLSAIDINPNVYRYISKRLQMNQNVINAVENSTYPMKNVVTQYPCFKEYRPTDLSKDGDDYYTIEL